MGVEYNPRRYRVKKDRIDPYPVGRIGLVGLSQFPQGALASITTHGNIVNTVGLPDLFSLADVVGRVILEVLC